MEMLSAVFIARAQLELELNDRQQDRLSRFHIHGWRWHQAALVRDAKRFQQAARLLRCGRDRGACTARSLDQAARWLLDVNLQDFLLVQNELFLPFLQKNLSAERVKPILRVSERHEQNIQLLAQRLRTELAACATPDQCPRHRQRLEQAATRLAHLMEQAYATEQSLVVAAVAESIPPRKQRSFEEQVRRRLNAEQKRLHVVSFYEAIKDDPVELARFRSLVPAPVHLFLGSWRRRWYVPATQSLDRCSRLGALSKCADTLAPRRD
ncbi:hypothetical protein F1559_002107 [Cyanidiococcus yangmingshanensis]|uniref:Uncharacterized protein n=1 Tax=Cyanidiococcus yangmingshanensis TaxID=2690220 RepID=A0A7J7IBV1_9RHOD|nr:hypothetical protein F1559_002107 [Cyanidiococcus yangmingshanensis]